MNCQHFQNDKEIATSGKSATCVYFPYLRHRCSQQVRNKTRIR